MADLGEVLNPRRRRRNIEDVGWDHFDTVCTLCDNGGVLICCEGKCNRSFHPTIDSEGAREANCETLGLLIQNGMQKFRCMNCLYSQHQCFVCGELGSSNEALAAEVFRCRFPTCRHFYHPECVANLLQPNVEAEQRNLLETISAGEPFICPAHICDVCKQPEAEKVEAFQFAVCRRCPTSYHRRCLPREIMFDQQDGNIPRGYDGILSQNRALIYCLNHEIDVELGTPARDVKFYR